MIRYLLENTQCHRLGSFMQTGAPLQKSHPVESYRPMQAAAVLLADRINNPPIQANIILKG